MRVLSSGLLCQQNPWILSFCTRAKPCLPVCPAGRAVAPGGTGWDAALGTPSHPPACSGVPALLGAPTACVPLVPKAVWDTPRAVQGVTVQLQRPHQHRVSSAGRRKHWTLWKLMAPGVAWSPDSPASLQQGYVQSLGLKRLSPRHFMFLLLEHLHLGSCSCIFWKIIEKKSQIQPPPFLKWSLVSTDALGPAQYKLPPVHAPIMRQIRKEKRKEKRERNAKLKFLFPLLNGRWAWAEYGCTSCSRCIAAVTLAICQAWPQNSPAPCPDPMKASSIPEPSSFPCP